MPGPERATTASHGVKNWGALRVWWTAERPIQGAFVQSSQTHLIFGGLVCRVPDATDVSAVDARGRPTEARLFAVFCWVGAGILRADINRSDQVALLVYRLLPS